MTRLRIDELAQQAGLTTRNVRAYQQQGLIPPPELDGRVGYYGPTHLGRLRTITRLRDRGYSLPAIRDLLAAEEADLSLRELLAVEEAARLLWHEEAPAPMSRADLEGAFPEIAEEPDLIRRAEELGLLRSRYDGEDLYEVASPRLVAIGRGLTDLGLPLGAVLDQAEHTAEHTAAMADRFVELFVANLDQVLGDEPMDAPSARLTEVLERLRVLVREAVSVQFARAVDEAVAARRRSSN